MAKALIVDDSKFMRNIIRDVLEEGGHEIIAEADNGADGIESYRAYNPDFVTMDITMGGKDGINAVYEIKKLNPDAKIVVVSALNENTIRRHAEDLDASAFVTKPFNKKELLEIVNSLFK
jgi:two-component system chemotaxis response regulator CheY